MFGSVSGTASSLAILAIVVCLDGAAETCGEAMSADFRLSLRILVNRFIVCKYEVPSRFKIGLVVVESWCFGYLSNAQLDRHFGFNGAVTIKGQQEKVVRPRGGRD